MKETKLEPNVKHKPRKNIIKQTTTKTCYNCNHPRGDYCGYNCVDAYCVNCEAEATAQCNLNEKNIKLYAPLTRANGVCAFWEKDKNLRYYIKGE